MDTNDFDVKLKVLYGLVSGKVTRVLYPFISFACAFKAENVHNMLALVLGPPFQRLECVIEPVGVVPARELVEEYSNHVFFFASIGKGNPSFGFAVHGSI